MCLFITSLKEIYFFGCKLLHKIFYKRYKKERARFLPTPPLLRFFFVIFTFCRSEETFLLVSPLVRERCQGLTNKHYQVQSMFIYGTRDCKADN